MSYHPIVVTLTSLNSFFFNGLKKELGFSDNAWRKRPRNPIRACRQSWGASLALQRQHGAGVLCPRRCDQVDTYVRKRPGTRATRTRTLPVLTRSQLRMREVCLLICRSSACSEYTLSPIMSIVREIITAHAGQITAQSREGQGTTFTITLPRTVD